MVSVATTVDGVQRLETLYRADGDRLWRALLAFAGDQDIASDSVAEAFAQALRRGVAVRDPRSCRIQVGLHCRGSDAAAFPMPPVGGQVGVGYDGPRGAGDYFAL